jgi:hypothetical protein
MADDLNKESEKIKKKIRKLEAASNVNSEDIQDQLKTLKLALAETTRQIKESTQYWEDFGDLGHELTSKLSEYSQHLDVDTVEKLQKNISEVSQQWQDFGKSMSGIVEKTENIFGDHFTKLKKSFPALGRIQNELMGSFKNMLKPDNTLGLPDIEGSDAGKRGNGGSLSTPDGLPGTIFSAIKSAGGGGRGSGASGIGGGDGSVVNVHLCSIADGLIFPTIAGAKLETPELLPGVPNAEPGKLAGIPIPMPGAAKGPDLLGPMMTAIPKLTEGIKASLTPMMILFELFNMALDRWMAIDSAVENVRKSTGLVASQYTDMFTDIKSISRENARFGVSVDDVGKSMEAVGKEFNNSIHYMKTFSSQFSVMEKTLGVSVETSAKFAKNIMGITDGSTQSAKQAQLLVVNLSKMAGVAPKQIMEDIANASETTLIMLRGSTDELIKGAIKARQFGLSIENISKSMEGMLDFESSMNNEMEASVLLGKHIDLMELRRLAYQGDAASYAEELNNKLQEAGDISQMTMFQQKALAAAMGIGVQEMIAMKAQQEAMSKIGRELSKEEQKRLEKLSTMTDIQSLSTEDLEKQLLLMADQENLQQKQTQMANQFMAIWTEIADILVPLVDALAMILVPVLKVVAGLVRGIGSMINKSGDEISKRLNFLWPIIQSFNFSFDKIGESLGKLLFVVNALVNRSMILKILPSYLKPIAILINGFVSLLSTIGGWLMSIGGRLMSIGQSILNIFKPLQFLIKPFFDLFSLFSKFLPTVSKFGGLFARIGGLLGTGLKAVPVLGQIIMIIQGVYYGILRIWDMINTIFSGVRKLFAGDIRGSIQDLFGFIMQFLSFGPGLVWDILIAPILDLIDFVFGTSLLETCNNFFKGLYDSIYNSPLRYFLTGSMPPFLQEILDFAIIFAGILRKVLLTPFEGLKMIIMAPFEGLKLIVDSIGNAVNDIGTKVKDILSLPGVESILKGIGGTVGAVGSAFGAVGSTFGAVGSSIGSAASTVGDWLVPDFLFGEDEKEGSDDKMDTVIELLTKLVEKETEMSVQLNGRELLKAITDTRIAQGY